ncbi:MAG: hypothetical protein AAF927_10770 [Bacteroidota bacterium]
MKSLLSQIFRRNPLLAWFGSGFFLLSAILLLLIPFNETTVLGINSLVKPLKFAVSIGIYAWTMAYLLHYFQSKRLVRNFNILIVVTMLFEQAVITVQAFRGTLSHFNQDSPLENILFGLMGLFISALTLYTLFAAFRFRKQSGPLNLTQAQKEGIFYGMLIFVAAGFIGGFMGSLNSHNIGGEMGEAGLPFVNWSTTIGDLRVSHFIGIHALQILPLVAFGLRRSLSSKRQSLLWTRVISLGYALVVLVTFLQALWGMPLWQM